MKIGIDLDDVLGESMEALIAFNNANYGTNLKIENVKEYDLLKILGVNIEEAIGKLNKFHETSYGKNIKPLKDSLTVLTKLKENNKLYIITSRSEDTREITEKWVDNNFPNIFYKIYFTAEFAEKNTKITKGMVCNKLGIDLLIEDNLGYAIESIAPNRKIFLFDRPWNQTDKLPAGITRVHSWKEICELICSK